jgi:hypothetical protein
MKVLLDDVKKVKNFVKEIEKSKKRTFLSSGDYKINAKILMAVFTLDLMKPIEVILPDGLEEDILNNIKKFEVF